MISWLRNNHLILFTTLVLLISVGALLYSIDRVVYQKEKGEIVKNENIKKLKIKNMNDLEYAAGLILLQANLNNEKAKRQLANYLEIVYLNGIFLNPQYQQPELLQSAAINENLSEFQADKLQQLIQAKLNELDSAKLDAAVKAVLYFIAREIIIDPSNSIFKIVVETTDLHIEFRLDEQELAQKTGEPRSLKTKANNNFRNCLFSRSFKQPFTKVDELIDQSTRNAISSGWLRFYFTTPPDVPQIERLTTKYRWITFGIVAVLAIFYFYLLWFLMLPVKRVVSRIDEIKSRRPRILNSPRSLLERRYNDLVRDALLMDINRHANELLSRSGQINREEIYRGLDEYIKKSMILEQVAFIEATVGATGGLQNFAQLSPDKSTSDFLTENQIDHGAIQGVIKQLQKSSRLENKFSVLQSTGQNGARQLLAGLIRTDEDAGRLDLLLGVPPRGTSREILAWMIETFERVVRHLHSGIETLELQKNMIVWEKRQANISLSRSLGHDLTNIIATSKIDLTTLKKFQEIPIEQSKNPERRLQLVGQALEHLINNTRYLQEIVNIYRSFSYIKHPKFEELDVNQELEDITQVFRMSSSRSLQLKTQFDKKVPVCFIEPRLFKLAIFNLLTNSVEAIKRQNAPKDSETIEIKTRYLKKECRIEIRVSDSGPGICDNEGKRLSSAKIEQIFELGNSTKKGDEKGEGLGLNWVKTILVEFHKGEIRAVNQENAGAEFIILLPIDLHPAETVNLVAPVIVV